MLRIGLHYPRLLLTGGVELLAGPGKEDDTDWEKRTGGVEGPVLAALRPLSANAITSKVNRLMRVAFHSKPTSGRHLLIAILTIAVLIKGSS